MAFEPIYMYARDGRSALVGSATEREQLRVKGYSETAPKPAAPAEAKPAPAPKPVAAPKAAEPASKSTK